MWRILGAIGIPLALISFVVMLGDAYPFVGLLAFILSLLMIASHVGISRRRKKAEQLAVEERRHQELLRAARSR